MPQAAGLDGVQCTFDESESTWALAPETLQALVTSVYGCMCCFAKGMWLLRVFLISEMRRIQQRSKLNSPQSCPEGWITARKDYSMALEKEDLLA